jgi:hypothetical protein
VDFVVVGFGLGALVLLIGRAVRDLAPRLSRQTASDEPDQNDALPADPRHFALAKHAPAVWGRACRSLGQVIMIGGGVIVVATGIGIVGQFADDSGARLVLAAALLAFGAIVVRAGQVVNSMYGADRRARARSRAVAVANPAIPSDHAVRDAETDHPGSAVPAEQSDAVSANGVEPHSIPTNGATPPLPDLQTLLGERRAADQRHRDEIVTLEQFLGLAPETPAPALATADTDGGTSADDVPAADETPVDTEPGGDAAETFASNEGQDGPVETEAAGANDDEAAVSGSGEKEPAEPQPPDEAAETSLDDTEDTADTEERPAAVDGQASAERSTAETEPVAQPS